MKVSFLKIAINCYDHLKIVKTISQQMMSHFQLTSTTAIQEICVESLHSGLLQNSTAMTVYSEVLCIINILLLTFCLTYDIQHINW